MHQHKNLAESLRSFNSQIHYPCLLSGDRSQGGGAGAAGQTGSRICRGSRCRRNQLLPGQFGITATPFLPNLRTITLPPLPALMRTEHHHRQQEVFFSNNWQRLSILKKVNLISTDSTSRKDSGLTPPGINLEKPHWLCCSLPRGDMNSTSVCISSALASETHSSCHLWW